MAIEISACPRLPEVLARLTTCDDAGWWRDVAARYDFRFDGEVILGAVGSGVTYDVGRFRPLHRAAAMEELVAAGLLPEQWLDDALAPRWWCERCGGGEKGREALARGAALICGDCFNDNLAAPPSRAALAAVSSLGLDVLVRAESVVAETWRGRPLVWRAMAADELREHHGFTAHRWYHADPGAQPSAPEVFTGLWHNKPEHREHHWKWFPEETKRAARACLALLDLGMHLVATDGTGTTIAVGSVATGEERWSAS